MMVCCRRGGWTLLIYITVVFGKITVNEYPSRSMEVQEHQNASISCKFTGTDISPNWMISGHFYTPSFLPSKHYYNGTALNIMNVSMSNNEATYCCFLLFRDGTNLTSNTTTLKVTDERDNQVFLSRNILMGNSALDLHTRYKGVWLLLLVCLTLRVV